MSNLSRFVGLPWACPADPPASFDCWDLVCAARAELGLRTPLVAVRRRVDGLAAAARSETAGGAWERVFERATGDVVLLGRDLSHCGLVIDGGLVLHSFSPDGESGAVRCDHWRLILRLFGRWEAWRCKLT